MSDLTDYTDLGGIDPASIRFSVVIQELGAALASGKGDRCLDLATGAIVPASGCPAEDTGEARPALRQGKRFVRLPTQDNLYQRFKQQLDNAEAEGDREWNAEAEGDRKWVDGERVHAAIDHWLRRSMTGRRDDFQGWCDFLRGERVQGKLALLWLANLRPDFPVLMVDECQGEPLAVYDPAKGVWVDLCGGLDDE